MWLKQFFFTKEKLQLVSTGNSLLQAFEQSLTLRLDYTFNFIICKKNARRCSNRFFLFTKKKLQLVSTSNSLLQTCTKLTPLVLIAHSIFFSFPPLLLRLREVHFIGCYEIVDQQTAELRNLQNSVNMQICSR